MYKLHCEIGIDEYILNLLKLWETNSWLLRYGLNKFQPQKMHILINFTCAQTFVQTTIISYVHNVDIPCSDDTL
jgi:hypothetical protein